MAKDRATFQRWCPFRGCLHRSFIVPSGFEAYARHLHPGLRNRGTSHEERALLRWSEIAEARGKTIHREVELHALIDDVNEWDNEHWKAISPRRQMASAPEALEEIEALRLLSLLRGATSSQDGWCMVWSGYGIYG